MPNWWTHVCTIYGSNANGSHASFTCASIISKSEVSITILCLLCSPHYTAVQIKNCLKSTFIMKVVTVIWTVLHAPVIVWNWSIHCPSLSAMFNSLHSSMNQEPFEKYLCNQGSHYEKYGRFPLHKESHHLQPLNQCFSLSAKINGTQGGHWKVHGECIARSTVCQKARLRLKRCWTVKKSSP